MARKRMLDPKIWESEQVMSLPSDAFKLYIYCISHADDEGRMSVSYPMIKSRCFPINSAKVSVQTVEKHLCEMAHNGLIWLYEVEGDWYLAHPNWLTYQTINHATASKLPPLPDDYRSPTVVIPPNIIKGNISKDNISKGFDDEIDGIIDYFNKKTGSSVKKKTEAQRSPIRARLDEGYSVEDCKKAIVFAYQTKKDDESQRKYIRISTIFRPSLFPGYVDGFNREAK